MNGQCCQSIGGGGQASVPLFGTTHQKNRIWAKFWPLDCSSMCPLPSKTLSHSGRRLIESLPSARHLVVAWCAKWKVKIDLSLFIDTRWCDFNYSHGSHSTLSQCESATLFTPFTQVAACNVLYRFGAFRACRSNVPVNNVHGKVALQQTI